MHCIFTSLGLARLLGCRHLHQNRKQISSIQEYSKCTINEIGSAFTVSVSSLLPPPPPSSPEARSDALACLRFKPKTFTVLNTSNQIPFRSVVIPAKPRGSSGLSQPALADNSTPPMGFLTCFSNVGCVAARKTPFMSPHKRFHASPKLSPLTHFHLGDNSQYVHRAFPLTFCQKARLAFLIQVIDVAHVALD